MDGREKEKKKKKQRINMCLEVVNGINICMWGPRQTHIFANVCKKTNRTENSNEGERKRGEPGLGSRRQPGYRKRSQ